VEKYYKTELHAHTKPASVCSDIEPCDLVRIYKENGYAAVCVTNHFTSKLPGDTVEEKVNRYLKDYYECEKAGKELGINVILGAEIRFTENHNDYLIYGICPEDLIDICNMLSYGIDRFYKEYKNDKNIIIQAHPFRDGMELVGAESLDGVEAFNIHPHHNSRIALAAKYAKDNNLIAVCGNDFHHYGHECLCSILTSEAPKDSYHLADILKKEEFTMEICGFTVK